MNMFITGAGDGTLRFWKLDKENKEIIEED